MDDLLSEKEQLEEMRAWWSANGTYVIVGLAIGILLLAGFNYYKNQQRDAQLAASALYEQLTNHVVDGRLDDAEAVVTELSANYADTAYLPQARLAIARLYMDQNRDEDAADSLRALIDSDAHDAFRHVARVRLAKVLLYQGKAEDVVDMLAERTGEGAFQARYAEALGDAYVALENFDAAREAYQLALNEPGQAATVDQQLVQLKLLDLPAAAPSALIEPSEAVSEAAEDAADEATE